VIIAVAIMRVMQVAFDQIIGVVAVRHRFVAAAGTVHMAGHMAGAAMIGRAIFRIGRGDLDHVFVDVIAVCMVQMSVMQVVHVIAVAYGGMAAPRLVPVRVIGVPRLGAIGHGFGPFLFGCGDGRDQPLMQTTGASLATRRASPTISAAATTLSTSL
jgi:hypothetical protein